MSQRPPVRIIKRKEGMTAAELARLAGVSVRTAQRWSSEPHEVYLARCRARAERIRELRAEGLTMRAIADRVGCGVGTVHRALAQQVKQEAQ